MDEEDARDAGGHQSSGGMLQKRRNVFETVGLALRRVASTKFVSSRENTHHVGEDVGDDLVGEPVHGAELQGRERQSLDKLWVHYDIPAVHVPRRLKRSVRRGTAAVRPSRRRPGVGQAAQKTRGAHGFWFDTRRPTFGSSGEPSRRVHQWA